MRAIIIAGGLGTRMRPLTYHTPKPLVPLANRPIILHQIEHLRQHGITDIIINLHYHADAIKKYLEGVKKELGVKLFYSFEKDPLGTAGAVKNAEEYFDEGPLIVFNGDTITDINVSNLIQFHYKSKAYATLALIEVEDPTPFGLVTTQEDGRIKAFIEKPSWQRVEKEGVKNINAGIYVLDPKVFKRVPKGKLYMFETDLFPSLLKDKEPMYGFITKAFWIDVGNPKKYMEANEAVLRGEVAKRIVATRGEKGIWVEDSAHIPKDIKLFGPLLIGKKVKIESGCEIRDYSILGEGVEVGKNSVIEHSIIWPGTKIGSGVKLNGCILGNDCRIEDEVEISPGTVIADKTIIKKGSKIDGASF